VFGTPSYSAACILSDSRRTPTDRLLVEWRRWSAHLTGLTGASIAAVLWTRALTPTGR
jgi:hypothetical protein